MPTVDSVEWWVDRVRPTKLLERRCFLLDVFPMYAGKILSISTDRGFGFIQATSGGADVFFHYTAVDTEFNTLAVGQQVRYVPDESAEKPRAKSVITGKETILTKQPAPRSFRGSRDTKPWPQSAEVFQFGFITKLHRGNMEGFISADQGGRELFFDATSIAGGKRFLEFAVGDYVRFVPEANDEDPKMPIARSVTPATRPVQPEALKSPKHPRSTRRKPTWR
jgi:CspA family cold shock protein